MTRITAWADRHLVPSWRKAHRFLSVRIAAAQAALLLAWPQVPDDMKSSLPAWLVPAVAIFVLSVLVGGVLTNQTALAPPKKKKKS